jgi:uncharacterized membrane protein
MGKHTAVIEAKFDRFIEKMVDVAVIVLAVSLPILGVMMVAAQISILTK